MYATGRKRTKGEKFRVYIATSFEHTVFCEIETLAENSGLANAQLVRELFLRGLAAYHRDGEIYEPAEPSDNDSSNDRELAGVFVPA